MTLTARVPPPAAIAAAQGIALQSARPGSSQVQEHPAPGGQMQWSPREAAEAVAAPPLAKQQREPSVFARAGRNSVHAEVSPRLSSYPGTAIAQQYVFVLKTLHKT